MPYKENGKWRAKITVKGQRYTSLQNTKKEAIQWEIRIRKRLKKILSGTNLINFCTKYLNYAEKFSRKVYEEKQRVCKRILYKFGPDILVDDITTEMADTFLKEQKELRSANAANKDRKNLLAMFNIAIKKKWGGVLVNPFTETTKFKHQRKKQYVPTPDDIKTLLSVLNKQEYVFIDTYLNTGARRTEIFNLKWQDIDFNNKTITLRTKKTKDGTPKDRTIAMNDELYESLLWRLNNKKVDSDFVFVNEHPSQDYGKPFVYRQRFMKKICTRAGIRPFGFHSLRRFVASFIHQSGKASMKQISILLGHESITTTERYIYFLGEDLKSTVDILSEIKGKGTKGGHEKEKELIEI